LVEICEKHSFKRFDAGPTYSYSKNDEVKLSTLDYFLSTSTDANSDYRVERIAAGFTDHDAVFVDLPLGPQTRNPAPKRTILVRSSIKNIGKFTGDMRRAMSQVIEDISKQELSTEECAKLLTNGVRQVIDKHAPKRRTVGGTNHRKQSDISEDTRDIMRARDTARSMIRKVSPSERK